ncbi:putative ankyrin repeat protein [Cotonvirus japonicus]|uniref:Ankyrin repeat protein n=1 Tax=Cotonvirus japonicus TaxID=2811091 RepID=A0ABM7NTT7_9VIRU|nr:putative ankyrin repeat protein [Cotonvirus japonicus]BCS83583.1 putative ankyrin repeat protein [Cotonvirus japonicus]
MENYTVVDFTKESNNKFFTIVDEHDCNSFNRYQYKTGVNNWNDNYHSQSPAVIEEIPHVAPVFFTVDKIFDKLFTGNFERPSNKSIRSVGAGGGRSHYTTSNDSNTKKGYFPCKNYVRQVFLPETNNKLIHNYKANHYVASKIIVDFPYDMSDINTIKWLIQQGANPCNRNLLRWAVIKNLLDVVKFLIEEVGVEYQSIYNYHTELSIAAFEGHADIVKYFVNLKINVEEYHNLALHIAAFRGNSKIFIFLSKYCSNLMNIKNTIMADVCSKGHMKIINGVLFGTVSFKNEKNETESLSVPVFNNLNKFTLTGHMKIAMFLMKH